MGMAYCYKKGKCRLSDFPIGIRNTIKRIAQQMSLGELRDFAKTKEKGLPYRKRRKR